MSDNVKLTFASQVGTRACTRMTKLLCLCARFSRPLSQPSQLQFSGMASESQHFALPPLRSSQLPNLQQLTQAHPVCGIPPSQLMQGSQATCTNAPLLASTSQPQSQMNLNDLHNPPPAPCVEGSRPKPAATPCTFDTQLQSCRQMQIKGSSAPGLSGNGLGLYWFSFSYASLHVSSGN